ncbi:MAG: WecB/TagA/CpsF family glycosyltransferase [Granulosicoccus sp.]|nr:WecB/TagA/CpsF family glycosyltransferase [Granulosicoccus sp.]
MAIDTIELPQYSLLGFFAHPGTVSDYLAFTERAVRNSERHSVLYHNLHSLYSYFTDAKLRSYYQGTTVLVDGMPVIWLMQLCRIPVDRAHRLTYVDFIMPLMTLARDNGWNVFHVGQQAQVQAKALDTVRNHCPGISIEGHDGYFDQQPNSPESLAVIEQINAADSQIVLIGFGAPKQEAWLHAHRHLINAPMVFTCGACMEYVAGAVRTPPRWMGRLGLEWSFRLLENPRRFAFRYFVEPVLLGAILLKNALAGWISERRA